MIRIAALGASGRMGRLVLSEILADSQLRLVAAVVRKDSLSLGVPVAQLVGRSATELALTAVGPDCFADADVVIDFSLPEGLAEALEYVPHALVSGTTGLSAPIDAKLTAFSARAPLIHAANFSTGINLLLHLAREAAKALPDYDVEIIETHHRLKQDSPSGTALALGAAIAAARGEHLEDVARNGREGRTGVRPLGEIGFHAVRGGDVVGDHDVWLLGGGERVCLGHVATSRATFASGAVRAAAWLAGKPAGRYQMSDVLGLGSPR